MAGRHCPVFFLAFHFFGVLLVTDRISRKGRSLSPQGGDESLQQNPSPPPKKKPNVCGAARCLYPSHFPRLFLCSWNFLWLQTIQISFRCLCFPLLCLSPLVFLCHFICSRANSSMQHQRWKTSPGSNQTWFQVEHNTMWKMEPTLSNLLMMIAQTKKKAPQICSKGRTPPAV